MWQLTSLIVLLSLPSLLWLHVPFWRLPLELSSQAPIFALAAAAASRAARAVPGPLLRRLAAGAAALALALALAFLLQLIRFEAPESEPLGAIAAALGLGFVTLREITRTHARAAAATLMALAAVAILGLALRDGWRGLGALRKADEGSLGSAYYPLEVEIHGDLVAKADRKEGGAMTRAGDALVAVTGAGAFYRLTPGDPPHAVQSRRIPLSSPANLAEFTAAKGPRLGIRFRVHGIATRRVPEGWEIFAAHHAWDTQRGCVFLAVSKARVDGAWEKVVAGWTPLFRAQPCFSPLWEGAREAGGRLAWADDRRLLLTTGDSGFDGWNRSPAVSQDPKSDYGKTLLLDADTGHAEPFTSGHRNPQGLFVGADGRIWSTEHGPQGGDELNLLVAGGNYGWPLATYGTEYFQFTWPPSEGAAPRPEWRAPVFSWVPSVGVSNLIRVEGNAFPRWRGNLLVASLAGETLFRVALDGDRVAYLEPLLIGRRIRDLREAPDGAIWLWTDRAEVVTIRPRKLSRGESVFAGCATCHDPRTNKGKTGPRLGGIIGRAVASQPGYDYSPALEALGGQWTEERLDAFLADPQRYAPGTAMPFALPDARDRAALIELLRSRR